MDFEQVLLSSLPILSKLTNGCVALTNKEGNRIKVIDAAGDPIQSLENRRLDLAARSITEGTILSGPSELMRDAEIWVIPAGEFALVVTDDGKRQWQRQLEYSLKESLSLIAHVIGGEASLYNEIGLITHSINRDGSINEQLIGQINQEAYSSMSVQKSFISESSSVPGAKSILIPITKHFGIEMSCFPHQEKVVLEKVTQGQAKYSYNDMIGQNASFLKVKALSQRVAKGNSSVLILGESGTGKELFAQAIHNSSTRANQKFTALNCGAIPDNLIESILFGYETGTFTGGTPGGKKGVFIEANKGTLFLDEISEMNITLQSRLLRVLQEKEFMPLGSTKSQEVDIRIIAATNRDLQQLIRAGKFREDLYYRLNVLSIDIPPLRERKDDIEGIVRHLIKEFNLSMNKRITGCSKVVLQILNEYNWPGNIRELRNCIERAVNLIDEGELEPEHLPNYVFSEIAAEGYFVEEEETLDDAVKRIERELIEQTLVQTKQNKQEAAKRLGISMTTLWRKVHNSDDGIKRIK